MSSSQAVQAAVKSVAQRRSLASPRARAEPTVERRDPKDTVRQWIATLPAIARTNPDTQQKPVAIFGIGPAKLETPIDLNTKSGGREQWRDRSVIDEVPLARAWLAVLGEVDRENCSVTNLMDDELGIGQGIELIGTCHDGFDLDQ